MNIFAKWKNVIQCSPTIKRGYARNSDLMSIKNWLNSFKGGSVELTRFEKSPDIALVTWSHTDRDNLFTGFMMSELGDIVSELDRNPPKGVIFRGAGGTYCSGGDINFISRIANPRDGNHFSKYMQWLTNRITSLSCVSVSLIEGSAIGGGAELMLCSDYRLSTPSSTVQYAQRLCGVTTGWGGGARLVRLLQREKALLALLRCNKIGSKEALKMHLIDEILSTDDSERALEESEKWLGDLVKPVPVSLLRSFKHLVNYIDYRDTQDALDEELNVLTRVWGKEDQSNFLRNLRKQEHDLKV